MAALKAITLDLWGTIFHAQDSEEKITRRRAMILEALIESGLEIDPPKLRSAYRATARRIAELVGKEARDLGPPGRWALLTEHLGLVSGHVPYERIAPAYEDLTLEFMPDLLPGVANAIERLRSNHRLGLICNTGYTGGKVLREVLKRHGLHDYFEILVFSNEFGWLKPDPRIFHHTLAHLGASPEEAAHVGDLEELDVDGAHAAGMIAARYLPDGPVETRAHVIFHHWDEFEAAMERRAISPG